MKNNKTLIYFFIFAFLGISLALTAYSGNTLHFLYFLWKQPALLFMRISCGLLFCCLILRLINQKFLLGDWLKLLGGIIFLPVLLLPILRCYFKVPYVFCRLCPDKCPWGLSRTFFFSSFVMLNFSRKFWCTNFCPFGTFQECLAQISKKHFKLSLWLSAFSYVSLVLVTGMYYLTLLELPWLGWFAIGEYAWALVPVFATGLIIVTAFFIPKFWCRYICPVGTIGDLSSKLRKNS